MESFAHNCELITFQFEIWGFCLLALERFLTLVVDSGSTPPFGKEGKNPSKGKGQKMDARNHVDAQVP